MYGFLFVVVFAAFVATAYADQYGNDFDLLVADICSDHDYANCSDPILDSDGDGVNDDVDLCDDTPPPIVVDATGCEVVVPPTGHILTTAPQNEWIRIPNTKASNVLPPESFAAPVTYPNTAKTSAGGIIGAWSGMAFSESRQEMRGVAGGGHADYCGNQDIGFNFDILGWTLHRGPTTDFSGWSSSDPVVMHADGNPNSSHTYNGTIFNEAKGEYLLMPGSLCSGSGRGSSARFAVNPDGTATHKGGGTSWALGWQLAYDTDDSIIYAIRQGIMYTVGDDYSLNKVVPTWGTLSGHIHNGVAMDSARNKILLVGTDRAREFDPIAKTRTSIADLLPPELVACYGPGLTFAASLDKYIGWCGGDLYLIDPVDYSYTTQAVTGTHPVKTNRGVYGRFAWNEKYGGVVMVDGIDTDVAFLKF